MSIDFKIFQLNILFQKLQNVELNKMINDKYKNQTQNTRLEQTPSWNQWINDNIPQYQNNQYQSFLNENLSPIESKYQSSYTIKSSQQQNVLLANQDLKSNILQNQNQQNQKIIINKCQLISFTQHFAQQKLILEKQIERVQQEKRKSDNEINKLKADNNALLQKIQSYLRQKQHERQKIIKQFRQKQNQYQQQLNNQKRKLKQITQINHELQKQLNGQKAKNLQIKKRKQFLQQKIKYQNDQVKRFQHLLKVKQDIIQNFQWEKSVNSSRLEKSLKKQKEFRNIIQNSISHHTNHNAVNRGLNHSLDTIYKDQNLSSKRDSNFSSYYKDQFNNRLSNLSQQANIDNQMQTKKIQINETLDLSQINFNNQHNISEIDMFQKQRYHLLQKKEQRPTKKYKIGKKSSQKGNQSSKTKLNISLKKINRSGNTQNSNQRQKIQQLSPQNKPKSIILRRTGGNNSSLLQTNIKNLEQNYKQQYQKSISSLQQYVQKIQKQHQSINQSLKNQNQMLKNRLLYISKIRSQNNSNSPIFNQSSILSQSQTYNNIDKNINQSQTNTTVQKLQRTNKLLKQKCRMLQKQISESYNKYLQLTQKYNELENKLTYYNEQETKTNNTSMKYAHNNKESLQISSNSVSKPSINGKDLVTPQFRIGVTGHNFFAKSKIQSIQSQFENVSLAYSHPKLLATFEKDKHNNHSLESSNIEIRNQFEYKIQKQINNHASAKYIETKIAPMSVSIYQNSMINQQQAEMIQQNQQLCDVQHNVNR